MEKRACERIPVNIEARFICDDSLYSGLVINLSENGMFINTRFYLPLESSFKILIDSDEEILKILSKVSRIVRIDNIYNGIGVELLNPPKEYLEFVNKLKPTL